MYSGTTFRKDSGKIMGVHQRIDRAARRNLSRFIEKDSFPRIKEILHFEGKNGPDSFKFSVSNSKPWHFINPDIPEDVKLLDLIDDHIMNLSIALRGGDMVRASFEAAWLAHAVVDGLTPPHHYSLDEKIKELWGKPLKEFEKLRQRSIVKGSGTKDSIVKNWEYWGAGGHMTTHLMYEIGVAVAMLPGDYRGHGPTENDLIVLEKVGFRNMFMESLYKVHEKKLFDKYRRLGWNRTLAKETKEFLLPEIIKVVTLGWYQAIVMSKSESSDK